MISVFFCQVFFSFAQHPRLFLLLLPTFAIDLVWWLPDLTLVFEGFSCHRSVIRVYARIPNKCPPPDVDSGFQGMVSTATMPCLPSADRRALCGFSFVVLFVLRSFVFFFLFGRPLPLEQGLKRTRKGKERGSLAGLQNRGYGLLLSFPPFIVVCVGPISTSRGLRWWKRT